MKKNEETIQKVYDLISKINYILRSENKNYHLTSYIEKNRLRINYCTPADANTTEPYGKVVLPLGGVVRTLNYVQSYYDALTNFIL